MTETAINAGAMNLAYGTPSMFSMNFPNPKPSAIRYIIGSRNGGRKFSFISFMKTSLFLCQTLYDLELTLGITK
jgi:hypothetical protein